MQSLFITGTDTSVGKTLVCGLLLGYCLRQRIDAVYQKWVATGSDVLPEDLSTCLDTAGLQPDPTLVDIQVPYRFGRPASPHLAAESEKTLIDAERIVAAFVKLRRRSELLIVEGVGGILVPLRRDLLLIDLVSRLRLPVVVVARSGLGTLNHTLLTIEALRQRRIPLLGVIFSDEAPGLEESLVRDNIRTVVEMSQTRSLGRLERLATDADRARAAFAPIGAAVLDALAHQETGDREQEIGIGSG